MTDLIIRDLVESTELDQASTRNLKGGLVDLNLLVAPKIVLGTSGPAINVQALTAGTIGGAFSGGVFAATGPEANILGSFKLFG